MGGIQTEREQPKKKGFLESMGLFTKIFLIIIVLGILYLIWSALTQKQSVWDFLLNIGGIGILLFLIWLAVKGVLSFLKPKAFSPRDDNFIKFVEMAKYYKPDNLGNLFFVGSKGKKRVLAGRIVGCLGIPYLVAEFERNEKGNVIETNKPDPTNPKRKLPKIKKISVGEDGDTLFIVEKGLLNIKTRYIRCNKEYHTDLNGDVEIDDINPYPHGRFEYPFKQIQADMEQLRMQSVLETLLTTNEYQLDLISMGVDKALTFNPDYLMARKMTSEQIQNQ